MGKTIEATTKMILHKYLVPLAIAILIAITTTAVTGFYTVRTLIIVADEHKKSIEALQADIMDIRATFAHKGEVERAIQSINVTIQQGFAEQRGGYTPNGIAALRASKKKLEKTNASVNR